MAVVSLEKTQSGARAKVIRPPVSGNGLDSADEIARQIVTDLAEKYKFGLNHFQVKEGDGGAYEIWVTGSAVFMANEIIEETVKKICKAE